MIYTLVCLCRYVLSCGKDSHVRLWEVGTGRQVKSYTGAQHPQMRGQVCKPLNPFMRLMLTCLLQWRLMESLCVQATFNHTEEFIMCVDETENEVHPLSLLSFKWSFLLQENRNDLCLSRFNIMQDLYDSFQVYKIHWHVYRFYSNSNNLDPSEVI